MSTRRYLPTNRPRGRPAREAVGIYLADHAAAMREIGRPLREIQAWLDKEMRAIGRRGLRAVSGLDKNAPHFREAAKYVKAGRDAQKKMVRILAALKRQEKREGLSYLDFIEGRAAVRVDDKNLVLYARQKPLPFTVVGPSGTIAPGAFPDAVAVTRSGRRVGYPAKRASR